MKKYTCTLLLIIATVMAARLNAQPVFLQKVPDNSRKYTITVEPFSYGIDGGIRTSFEMRIKNTHQWLQAKPTVYYLPYDRDLSYIILPTAADSDAQEVLHGLKGAGIELGYKLYLNKPEVFYCKAGFSYTHLSASYSALVLSGFVEDGLHYYFYERQNIRQAFNNIGVNACVGVQSTMRRIRFFVGGYIGIAYNMSFSNNNVHQYDALYNFGYNGFSCIFGFQLGWAFGRTKDTNNTATL